MPSVTRTYILGRFPGVFDALDTASPTALNDCIVAAQGMINAPAYGASANDALLFLACHIAELTKNGRASGLQVGKAGQVTIDFGAAMKHSTSFLELFNMLQKRRVLRIGVVTG